MKKIFALLFILFSYSTAFGFSVGVVYPKACTSSTASFSLLSLVITKVALDSTAFLGILLVFAIVVNNIILIFSRSKQLNGFHTAQSVALAAKSRLRPIIMTMGADVVGFLPLAIEVLSTPLCEFIKPLQTRQIRLKLPYRVCSPVTFHLK